MIDIVPTMLEGVEQEMLVGTNLLYTFDDTKTSTQHSTQYFELLGNRAIYKSEHYATTVAMGHADGERTESYCLLPDGNWNEFSTQSCKLIHKVPTFGTSHHKYYT
jgi:arylsulfatase